MDTEDLGAEGLGAEGLGAEDLDWDLSREPAASFCFGSDEATVLPLRFGTARDGEAGARAGFATEDGFTTEDGFGEAFGFAAENEARGAFVTSVGLLLMS